MTEQTNPQSEAQKRAADAQARGAGTGANAVQQRQKTGEKKGEDKPLELPKEMFAKGKSADDYKPDNYDPESEYPEGDASKGKPDFEARARGCNDERIPMRDHRAYLVSQAEKNERANDEIQARSVEELRPFEPLGILNDPDYQRDTSMETALAEVEEHTAEAAKKRAEHRKAMAEDMKEKNLPVTLAGGKEHARA